jgi:translin
MSLDPLAKDLLALFETKDAAREDALRLARSATRESSWSIKALHRGQVEEAKEHLKAARTSLDQIRILLKDHPDVRYAGFVDDAEAEYAEAMVVNSIISSGRLPAPLEVGVEPRNYLSGLGDATGELRRRILDLMREGRPDEGLQYLQVMEEIYQLLMLFDYPDAITRGLRRKSDLARSMVERTYGELTGALADHRLERRLREMEDKLKDTS